MTTTNLPDPFDPKPNLADPFETDSDDGLAWIDRPERSEDRVPRDKNQNPRILPVGMKMPSSASARNKALRSYQRPSGYAEVIENHYNLDRWRERMIAAGLMQERKLQLELAAIGEFEESRESKDRVNDILKRAQLAARAQDKADEGTGVHALTERLDHGLPIKFVPEEFKGNLEDWKRLTQHFRIEGIEVFVVEDKYRIAGTFDRLIWYHVPCPNCGKYYRIGDLKTGSIDYGGMKMSAQLAIYAHGQRYDPATGIRTPLPDVCLCRGVIWHIPSGQPEGSGRVKWINIAQGWNDVVRVAYEIRELRRRKNWWLDFEPEPDIMSYIEDATTREEFNQLWKMHQGQWTERHTEATRERMAKLGI